MKNIILWFPLLFPIYVLRFKLGPFPTTALELAFIALAVCTTWQQKWRVWRAGFEQTKSWHVPAALWIVATLIAIFVAPNHLAAFGLWRAYVLEPMLYALVLAGTIARDEDRRTVIMALVGAVTFVAVIALLQYIGALSIPHPWNTNLLTQRATGPFPFPNAVALFCAPIAAMCIGSIVADRASRVHVWLGYLAGTLATLLAKSIGGFLAILVATLLALIWNAHTRRVTIIVATIVVMLIAATPNLRAPIISSLTFNEWSGKVRIIMWRETWQMLKDRPLFGAGFGAYPEALKPYHRAIAIEIFQYPHNLLLTVWSETGLLGFMAFGWVCVTWIRSGARRWQTHMPFLLPLVAISIHGLVDVPYFKNDLAFLFWTCVVLTRLL